MKKLSRPEKREVHARYLEVHQTFARARVEASRGACVETEKGLVDITAYLDHVESFAYASAFYLVCPEVA